MWSMVVKQYFLQKFELYSTVDWNVLRCMMKAYFIEVKDE